MDVNHQGKDELKPRLKQQHRLQAYLESCGKMPIDTSTLLIWKLSEAAAS
jgi:hypothetical protein